MGDGREGGWVGVDRVDKRSTYSGQAVRSHHDAKREPRQQRLMLAARLRWIARD